MKIKTEIGSHAGSLSSVDLASDRTAPGVYRCLTHSGPGQSQEGQRVIKTCSGYVVICTPGRDPTIRPLSSALDEASCRYVLADEQNVTVKISK